MFGGGVFIVTLSWQAHFNTILLTQIFQISFVIWVKWMTDNASSQKPWSPRSYPPCLKEQDLGVSTYSLQSFAQSKETYKERLWPCWQVSCSCLGTAETMLSLSKNGNQTPLVLTIRQLPQCLQCMCQSTARTTIFQLFIRNFSVKVFDTWLQLEASLTSDCNTLRTIMTSVSRLLGFKWAL